MFSREGGLTLKAVGDHRDVVISDHEAVHCVLELAAQDDGTPWAHEQVVESESDYEGSHCGSSRGSRVISGTESAPPP